MKKAIDKMVEVKPIKMPWGIARFFPEDARYLDFHGDQVSLGEDYASLDEIRNVVDWLADQFGGAVKWEK